MQSLQNENIRLGSLSDDQKTALSRDALQAYSQFIPGTLSQDPLPAIVTRYMSASSVAQASVQQGLDYTQIGNLKALKEKHNLSDEQFDRLCQGLLLAPSSIERGQVIHNLEHAIDLAQELNKPSQELWNNYSSTLAGY